jgi:hypothetical protein
VAFRHQSPPRDAASHPPLEIVPPSGETAPAPPTLIARLADLAGVFALPLAGLGAVLLVHFGLGTSIAR